jgi:hypothetical protein
VIQNEEDDVLLAAAIIICALVGIGYLILLTLGYS